MDLSHCVHAVVGVSSAVGTDPTIEDALDLLEGEEQPVTPLGQCTDAGIHGCGPPVHLVLYRLVDVPGGIVGAGAGGSTGVGAGLVGAGAIGLGDPGDAGGGVCR